MLKYDASGLIPAVVQDERTRDVLMLAYMNAESLRRTIETGDAWFWSRSRQELWHKGATSGNYQRVVRMRYDCDADAVLLEVNPAGPACHTGAPSCFFRSGDEMDFDAAPGLQGALAGASHPSPLDGALEATDAGPDAASSPPERRPVDGAILDELVRVVAERHAAMPEGSYVAQLLAGGVDRVAKKVGEEAVEAIIAAKGGSHDEIVWEVADLWFHTVVLLEATGTPAADVWRELARRRR